MERGIDGNRSIVRPVKIAWRNNILARNPITRSFKKFRAYGRNWENGHCSCCSRPGGERATSNGQLRKYRIAIDDEARAKAIAGIMDALAWAIDGYNSQIEFGIQSPSGTKCLSTYATGNGINHIVMVKCFK